MSTTITVLSGYGAKKPAAILVDTGAVRLLLDAGGSLESSQTKGWEFPTDLDAIIISHDHIDHCHGLKDLQSNVTVYATQIVADLLPGTINAEVLPLCGSIDIAGISVNVGQAGHSLAGIWIHLAIDGGIFYSGDFSLESQLFPFDSPPPAKTALLDASYGLYQQSVDENKAQLLAMIVTQQQIVMPVPPTGRALEIALFLQQHGFEHWRLGDDCLNVSKALALPSKLFTTAALNQLTALKRYSQVQQSQITICGDADGEGGEALALIDSDALCIYTGYLPDKAKDDVDRGKAQFVRWNVHPRMSDLTWLIKHLNAQVCLPLFCEITDQPLWQRLISEHLIFTPIIQVNNDIRT